MAPEPVGETVSTETIAVDPVVTSTVIETFAPAGPIEPDDVDGFVSEAARLPVDYVQDIVWTGPEQFMLLSEENLYPVMLLPLQIGSPQALNLPGRLLAIAPDASSAAVIAENDRLGLYDLNGELLHETSLEGVYFANYSADSRWLTAGESDRMAVNVIDASSGDQIARLSGFETAAPVYSATTAPGAHTVLWWARATLQFQDVASGEMGERLGYQDFVSNFAFDSSGRRLAVAVMEQIDIFSVPDAQIVVSLSLSQPARDLAFSPDGKLLAAAYGETVQLWETVRWQPLPPLIGAEALIQRVDFSPDGQAIVSLDESGALRVWKKP